MLCADPQLLNQRQTWKSLKSLPSPCGWRGTHPLVPQSQATSSSSPPWWQAVRGRSSTQDPRTHRSMCGTCHRRQSTRSACLHWRTWAPASLSWPWRRHSLSKSPLVSLTQFLLANNECHKISTASVCIYVYIYILYVQWHYALK